MNFCFKALKTGSKFCSLATKTMKTKTYSTKNIQNAFRIPKTHIEPIVALSALTNNITLLSIASPIGAYAPLVGLTEDGEDDDAGC